MLSALDFLGRLKWPSLLAVVAVPAVSFAFWGGFDDPKAARLYGPEAIGPVVAILSHDAAVVPASGGDTYWCARLCAACGRRLERLELAYSARGRAAAAVAAEPDGGQLCATLPWPAGARFDAVTARVVSREAAIAEHSWPLDRPPPR